MTKKSLKLAEYLAHQMEISDLKQREIALALGYTKPNIITMFKQGMTKVPIEKIPALATALGLDPAHLLSMAMREYMPESFKTIQETMGHVVSKNEYAIVDAIREITKDRDPPLTKELKGKLKAAFA
jgi:predicted XRE-type DNA-binding protein